jgi:hypothetical protein
LEDIVDQPARPGGKRPSERADDSGGHGVVEAQGIADRDGDLAHADLLRIGEAQMPHVGQINAQHREVGVGIIADDLGARFATVGCLGVNRFGAMHDMAVGHDKTVRRNEEARSAAAAAMARPRLDMHDGRTGLAHGRAHRARIRIEESQIGSNGGRFVREF